MLSYSSQHCTVAVHAVTLILVNFYGIELTVQVTMLFSGLKLLAIVFIVAVGVVTVSVCQSVLERLHQPFQLLECHQKAFCLVSDPGSLWSVVGFLYTLALQIIIFAE